MTFEQMAKGYLGSAKFLSLEKNSKGMYTTYTNRLIELGGALPIVDAPMQMPVALKRSPRGVAAKGVVVGNLASEWFKRIDKGCETNPVKLTMRTMLSVLYKWGVLHGYLMPSQNPVPYIDKQAWRHEAAEKRPYLKEEIDWMYEAAMNGKMPDELIAFALFCVVLFDLGCRPEEAYEHQNTWFSKRDNDRYFDIHNAKGKARGELSRYVVMGDRVQRITNWFRTQPIAFGCGKYTFRNNNGYRFHQATVCAKMKEVCRFLGIEERPLYNTRRGCAKAMMDAGQSIYDGASRLGNSPEVFRKHYASQSKIDRARSGIPEWQK